MCLRAREEGEVFRRFAHLVYLLALLAVGYAVFGLGLPSVITVYFPALVLLAAAHILGARAALFWGIPSIALVALGVFFPPPERPVTPAITFAVRAATLITILGFAVAFRRAHDRQAEELRRHATMDPLTGLANRREFDRAVRESLGRADRFQRSGAILYLDLDGVKRVNDTFGHEAGDDLIRLVAERISENTRAIDTAARLGGDEFAVLLSEVSADGGEIVARKLLESIREPVEIAGKRLTPAASIGLAPFSGGATPADELVSRADGAMYEAKRAGGDRIFVDDGGAQRNL